jgi:hypothetical protein
VSVKVQPDPPVMKNVSTAIWVRVKVRVRVRVGVRVTGDGS